MISGRMKLDALSAYKRALECVTPFKIGKPTASGPRRASAASLVSTVGGAAPPARRTTARRRGLGAGQERMRHHVLLILGQLQQRMRLWGDATESYSASLLLRPECVLSLVGLGAVAEAQVEHAEAAVFYRKAASLMPSDLEIETRLQEVRNFVKAGCEERSSSPCVCCYCSSPAPSLPLPSLPTPFSFLFSFAGTDTCCEC